MAEAPTPESLPEPARRRARRLATIVFLGLVGAWVLGASGQIVRQVLWPEMVASPYPTCRDGLRGLHAAVVRARIEAEGDLDPRVALARYRAGLDPEWKALTGVRATCTDARQRRSLDALERLRYAEEHAVRREAASLAALRQQVASDIAAP